MPSHRAVIILPTRKRAKFLRSRLELILRRTPEIGSSDAFFIVAADVDDNETIKVVNDLKLPVFFNRSEEIPCMKWNFTVEWYEENFVPEKENLWYVTLSDDCEPVENWLSYALDETKNSGFIGLPDLITGERNKLFTPLYTATRKWLVENNDGLLVPPYYKSWYGDIEIAMKAQASNTYVVGWRSGVLQLHSCFNTAPDDEMYKLGRSRQMEDSITFQRRQVQGFPNTREVKPVITQNW